MKFLFEPLRPLSISQEFGQNKACYNPNTGKVISCDGNNPPTGYRSLYGKAGHTGIDCRARLRQEVYCAADGVVDYIDKHERTGFDVRIVTEINGEKYKHIYEHLNQYKHMNVGDTIRAGELVGWAGTTGYSSGVHLHFQLEKEANGKWVKVDPLPHIYRGLFARYALEQKSTLIRLIEELIAKLR